MFRFFRKRSSGQLAKDRLKILLISDRINCSPEMLEIIKNELAMVISKYMMIDESNMDVQISKSGFNSIKTSQTPCLCANIPILELKYKT